MRQQGQIRSFLLKTPASQTVEIDIKADCCVFLLMTDSHSVGQRPALFWKKIEN
jgi:hypothetical protein